MNFDDVVRTALTSRFYKPDPVDDEVLLRALDAARFAPAGGNRQPVRYIVVRDQSMRTALKELYLRDWRPGSAKTRGEPNAEARRVDTRGWTPPTQFRVGDDVTAREKIMSNANYMAEHLDEVPVHIVVCAELASLAITDAGTGRQSVVGGASIYPSVQNFLLGCRNQGLGAALTTYLCGREAEVKELLNIPDGFAVAALIPVGWPVKPLPSKPLNRRPLAETVFAERFGNSLTTHTSA
ncbi:nitroreductase family protein [Mycobacterium syngnathidarum]